MNSSLYQAFFGNSEIKERVIISPILYPKKLQPGAQEERTLLNYTIAASGDTTFIKCAIGPSHIGDLTLMLKKTPCRKAILLGTIGSLKKQLRIGRIFLASSAVDGEGFSGWLIKEKLRYAYKPSLALLKKAKEKLPLALSGSILTVGSLLAEGSKHSKGFDGIDMESSAFFAAARYSGIDAVGIYVISDQPSIKPFYITTKKEQAAIAAGLRDLIPIVSTL